jgi:hypothetical protein
MDRYIPVKVSTLVDHLCEDLFLDQEQQKQFRQLATLAEKLLGHFASEKTRQLSDLYDAFDPDTDTVLTDAIENPQQLDDFFNLMSNFLKTASFESLADETFKEVAKKTTHVKVKTEVNLHKVERFSLYHRGIGHKASIIRPIQKMFKKIEVEIPTYTRVIIITRTKENPFIEMQLYKDVAQEDVELLLPTIDIRMKLLDRLKLSGASGSAFISAVKLLRTMVIQIPKFLALPFKIFFLPLIIVITLVYGGKAFLDYSKIKQQYLEALREHLHSLSLAKNSALLALSGSMTSQENVKKFLICYAFLLKSNTGMTSSDLSDAICKYVNKRFASKPKFDVQEGLELLKELDVVFEKDGGKHTVASIDEALWTLDHIWDELYQSPTSSSSS